MKGKKLKRSRRIRAGEYGHKPKGPWGQVIVPITVHVCVCVFVWTAPAWIPEALTTTLRHWPPICAHAPGAQTQITARSNYWTHTCSDTFCKGTHWQTYRPAWTNAQKSSVGTRDLFIVWQTHQNLCQMPLWQFSISQLHVMGTQKENYNKQF